MEGGANEVVKNKRMRDGPGGSKGSESQPLSMQVPSC